MTQTDDGAVTRVGAEELRQVIASLFAAVGMSDIDASLMAETLVASDLRGVPSHGVLHVPGYLQRLTVGGVDPRGRPSVSRRKGGALRIDAGNNMGQIAGAFAMGEVVEAASEHGVAFASVGNSNHCGALAYFAMQALERGQIGLAFTNAIPTMAPWGGRDRILGINPFAVAMPVRDGAPFVLDISFSTVSRSKVVFHQQTGAELADGWALDERGRPTRDPAAALKGLLLPIGAHKGTGLAMVSGILSTLLSGAEFGPGVGSLETGAVAGADGHAFMALEIDAFEDRAVFEDRMDQLLAAIRQSSPAEGEDEIVYPGERAAIRVAENARRGVPLSEASVEALRGACSVHDVDPGPLAA